MGIHGVERAAVRLTVNGRPVEQVVEARRSLADFLREDLDLTGTHVGCEHGVCGACTVLVDGRTVRSCLLLAVQLDGASVTTIEGLTPPDGLSPLQEAFRVCHALQCGFCTPGMIVTSHELLVENPDPTTDEIREGLSGNLCMCTGYVNIVRAVARAAATLREEPIAGREGPIASREESMAGRGEPIGAPPHSGPPRAGGR
jgi:aerobic carbon-monoxide dehydrogenase small subunit